MTDENMSEEDKIRAVAEALGMGAPDQSELDRIRLYQMEQEEQADELFRSALADGVNFATTDAEGDVFVNTKWIAMVIKTVAEVGMITGDLPEQTQRLAEVLGQTILAAEKFTANA